MPWIAPVAGGVASLAGGMMAAGAQNHATDTAAQLAQQSVADLEKIGIPTIEAQKIVLEQYKSQGQYVPQLEEAVKLGDSNMLGVATDPNSKAAQMQALNKLKEIGDSGGMTLSDRAALESQMGNIDASARGKREAILQDAHQRGGYGSGTALAAQLMNQQDSSNQAHAVGVQTAGQAQARALQAIQAAGQLGGQMQQQDFSQKASQAQAQDAINQWNAANQQTVGGTNTGYGNAGQQYNLQNNQNISNANTDTRNKQETYNQGLYQQQFQNQMQKAGAAANARAGQATAAQQAGNNTAGIWNGIGSGVNQAATAYGQMQNSNDQRAADRSAYGGYYGGVGRGVKASLPQEEDPFKNIG